MARDGLPSKHWSPNTAYQLRIQCQAAGSPFTRISCRQTKDAMWMVMGWHLSGNEYSSTIRMLPGTKEHHGMWGGENKSEIVHSPENIKTSNTRSSNVWRNRSGPKLADLTAWWKKFKGNTNVVETQVISNKLRDLLTIIQECIWCNGRMGHFLSVAHGKPCLQPK